MAKVQTTSIAAGEPLADQTPSTSAPLTVPVPQVSATPAPVAGTAAPTPAAETTSSLRPGLETPPAPADPAAVNPFVRLIKWKVDESRVGSLSAMEVPGGCLVKSSFAWPGFMGESLCFVPDVVIKNGKLELPLVAVRQDA